MDHDPHQAEGERLPQPLHCALLNLTKWLQKAAGNGHVLRIKLQRFGSIEAKWGNVWRTDVFPPGKISEAAWSLLLRIQCSKYSPKDNFFPYASLCWNSHIRQSRRSTGLRRCCRKFWLRKVVIFGGFSRSHSEIRVVTYSPGKHQQLQVLNAPLTREHWLPWGWTGGRKCWSSPGRAPFPHKIPVTPGVRQDTQTRPGLLQGCKWRSCSSSKQKSVLNPPTAFSSRSRGLEHSTLVLYLWALQK